MDAAATMIQAFVSSRLNYCNSVLNGITENLFNAWSRCRTQQPGWSHRQDGVSTSRLSYDNFTGCLFDSVLISSWLFSCTRLYTVLHRRIYPTTLCWWRKSTSAISWCMDMCCTADQGPVWWQEICCGWSAGLHGIVCRLYYVTLTVFTAPESSWRRFCLVAAVAHSDYVFARYKYSYLLTCLLIYRVQKKEHNCFTYLLQIQTYRFNFWQSTAWRYYKSIRLL